MSGAVKGGGGLVALADRLEQRRGLLGAFKIANVGLAILWGFSVTFVFVRLLPISEFRSFLLLVAFANFTISAELGFSTIIYSRLRRRHVTGEGDFRNEELGVLLVFMGAIVVVGALALLVAIALGAIHTNYPGLFIAFYGVSAANLIALLARRGLAALDHNLWWEALDLIRRGSSIVLLVAALLVMPILLSVLIQLGIAIVTILIGLATIHRSLTMPMRHWWAWRVGGGHIRARYLGDIGRTSLLTVADVAAINAPYFTIVAATHDVRPLLLFDFLFKMARALSALIRAIVETLLPDLTRSFLDGDARGFRRHLMRSLLVSLVPVALIALLLLSVGGPLSRVMFDGKFIVQPYETVLIILLFIGLMVRSLSVYLNNGLGRFAALVPPAMLYAIGSLASVPLALWLARASGWSFTFCFMALFAALHLLLGLVHGRMLARLDPKAPVS